MAIPGIDDIGVFETKLRNRTDGGQYSVNIVWKNLRDSQKLRALELLAIDIDGPPIEKPTIAQNKASGRKHVYVMIDKRNGRYKIGVSQNPEFREKTLQSEVPQIELLFSSADTHAEPLNNGRYLERMLHEHYASNRVRGEWFKLKNRDLGFIKRVVYEGVYRFI